MPSDDMRTMYDNPLSELLYFLIDFTLFCAKAVYFFLETLVLSLTPNRFRTMKVGVKWFERDFQPIICIMNCANTFVEMEK